EGAVTVYDLELDGETEFVPGGTVLPPMSDGDCSATVISKEMLDLSALSSPSFGSGEQEMVHCATNFLRHYVYDCDGKVKDVYDTGTDGVTPYQGGSEAVGAGGAVPSMTVIPWLPGAHTAAPEDNGQNKLFHLPVANSKGGETGAVFLFETEQPSNLPESPDCNSDGDYVLVSTPRSVGQDSDGGGQSDGGVAIDWKSDPQNQSKFTFTPATGADQLSMIRIEFHDLDSFESIWGLTPWPAKIVDEAGNTDTFEVDEESGSIRSSAPKINLFAYYNSVPEKIEYWYHNLSSTDPGCRAARITGYSVEPGPCCSGCEEDVDVGCETFVLKDQQEDGSESFFLRKICKERDGTVILEDTELDGTTPYTPEGNVLPPASGGDCSATVFAREMWDLAPTGQVILDDQTTEKQCATTFLRHYVYDCDGKIKEVYDTETDGLTAYEAVQPIEARGAKPSVRYAIWPMEGVDVHEDDNGENRRHWFNVRNPETEEVGRLEFETEVSNDPFCDTYHPNAHLVVTLNESTGRWFTEPNNQSKMTFRPDDVTKQMAMLRLDFADLDMFEAVWGLTPWPDKIVDASNNEPRMVDNEADALLYVDSATEIPETFLVYPELGAIRARENNLVVHAYYNTIPEEISYRYHNFRNGKSCHIPEFTGYALQEGPCCNGCEDDIDVGCETFI